MDYITFYQSLQGAEPPEKLSLALQSLWWDAKGDWDKAHDLISERETQDNNRIHAYLHRKEGDIGNAEYWYARAAAKSPGFSLEEEWRMLVEKFLAE